ncbi:MAG: tRNA 2-thiouridine(34) synthase MnmA [Deltaproteobacteria bacterium]|nr:tRNA 2-thiouridine(34) synthase MnmA [Deltaproteobacteria bacterium]MBW1928400.1 tRNA 2-thiouridine(34) synthase MnmA [Deltaproteobacteria bacterium]MBW2023801.1 tRNA 2-thiouridine(34) synthase MnmA [Deltaproteobacteria bacterium]MBW2124327.1 tRNA 2-thiouridine(34) synthase MnmA [Deltaproteobacteria bacterium]RLB20366.1 MAG: tRNA 2-thiouridine(34) synthase MnmA [Deltaproteobacteria bacterium]
MKRRISVGIGLSGGVDSSVAAALLVQQGYHVVGLSMKIFDPSIGELRSLRNACFGPGEEQDIEAASEICKHLGIPFHCIDLTEEYRQTVLDYFRQEYLAGRTPNPCIVCNKHIKFDLLIKKAWKANVEFQYFATGHYARIEKSGRRYVLKKGLDPEKDQSYFLYSLSQKQLSRTLFPLGRLTKHKVRKLAISMGLKSADRPESQDFLSGGNYGVLFHKSEMPPGQIVDQKGNLLGYHKGIGYYTIGQRRGLGISAPHPLYVIQIDAEKNRIVVGPKEQLFSRGALVSRLNLIIMDSLGGPLKVTTKIRFRHKEAHATLIPHEGNRALVLFDKPQRAVTPGQSAVFYLGDLVVGGGIIEESLQGK